MSVTPSGSDIVVMDSEGTVTLILNGAEAVRGGFPESATWTVKFEVPPAHGVPAIVPSVPKSNPVGREPDVTLQENGGMPPDSCRVAVYAVPPVPLGKDVVVTEGGRTICSESVADFVLSVTEVATTWTLKANISELGAVYVTEVAV